MLTRREALRQASVLGAGALDAGYDAFVNGTCPPSYLTQRFLPTHGSFHSFDVAGDSVKGFRMQPDHILGTRKAYVEV